MSERIPRALRYFKLVNADLWIDEENINEYELNFVENFPENAHRLFNKQEREFIRLYGERIRKPRVALLNAHGFDENGVWYFVDGSEVKEVQSWIDARDGEYGLLFLYCCNTGLLTPRARKSLLAIPNAKFSLLDLNSGDAGFDLVHPTSGDLGYTIEYELAKLKKAMAKP